MVKVAPSLLAADLRVIGAEIERMAAAGADQLHFDVMDGSFVPNITFGSGICKAAARGPLPVDAHLMVERPEAQVANFAKAGAKPEIAHEAPSETLIAGLVRQGFGVAMYYKIMKDEANYQKTLDYVLDCGKEYGWTCFGYAAARAAKG